ncbi:heterodimeric methylmalonyl-CoA mutase small subunit [Winogradskyella epiphytica]|uniref:Heterodimeric methylmalonyl-CoA mutase small subunit n=1 Tax=Winogradskyella epiphytica TaxID=262005 RepID=A0A2V4WYI4_9FLAO|nr:methylmalonyl-CoA mutase subunit beta [Winogradskyella epiphytica]PYE82082.1 heterodimeric methylmalonyl-CoA mutase small subunit [Winogradskyella epiphytica]GGW60656.1 methylmalonyl-CoA mutase [Winogradskyella epiphytica]
MSKSLFNDFDPVSSKAWKQKIQVDLKGADYNETLIWNSNEGIDVKPFYHADEFESLLEVSQSKSAEWKIGQLINVTDAKTANSKAIEAINRGAENIIFNIESETVSIDELVQNIDLEATTVDIKCQFLSQAFVENLYNSTLNSENVSSINIQTDIIGHLAKSGNWYHNLKEDHSQFENIVATTNQLSVHIDLYQNAGATMIQQLAYGMAHANEYLNHLDGKLSKEDKASLVVVFNLAVGSNYFFEISKIRALRQLWSALATEYGVNTTCRIVATPSKRNKTIYDYNVNMLRTTTECMSAILGGADLIHNLPYDALFHKPNEFGERISRNQLLVLKHESYLDKVNNPADGTYYIESLTEQLAEKALELFKDIEANGGFLSQLKEGTIQRKIKESAAKEQADFNDGKLVLLGTNKHPNKEDNMKNDLEISPFLEINKRKTLLEPIIEKRLSQELEFNRLNKE